MDGSFHSPEWHAARLASLKTSHTITWEEYKKKQKVIFFFFLCCICLYIFLRMSYLPVFLEKEPSCIVYIRNLYLLKEEKPFEYGVL